MNNNTVISVVIDPTGAQRGAAAVNNALNGIIQTVNNVNINVVNGFDNINNNAGRAANGLRSIANISFHMLIESLRFIKDLISALVSELVKVDAIITNFRSSMTAANLSFEEGAQKFDLIKKLSIAYGVSLESLLESYSKLKVSMADSFSPEAIDSLFIGLTQISSALHLTETQTKLVGYALSQIASKGKVSSEELLRQLGEHIPGTLKLAANSLNITTKELLARMKAGTLGAQEFLDALGAHIPEVYGQAAKEAATSIRSELNRLQSIRFNFSETVLDGGAKEGIANFFQAFNRFLGDSQHSARTLGDVIGTLAQKMANFLNSFSEEEINRFWISVSNTFAAIGALIEGIGVLVQIIYSMSDVLIAITPLIVFFRTAIGLASTSINVLGLSIGVVRTLVLVALSEMAAMAIGWAFGTALRKHFDGVLIAGNMLASGLHQIVATIGKELLALIQKALGAIATVVDGAINLYLRGKALITGNKFQGSTFFQDYWFKAAKDNEDGAAATRQAIRDNYVELTDAELEARKKSAEAIAKTRKKNTEISYIEDYQKKLIATVKNQPKLASSLSLDDSYKRDSGFNRENPQLQEYRKQIADFKQIRDDANKNLDLSVKSRNITKTQEIRGQIENEMDYYDNSKEIMSKALTIQKLTNEERDSLQRQDRDLLRDHYRELKDLRNQEAKDYEDFVKYISDLAKSEHQFANMKSYKFNDEFSKRDGYSNKIEEARKNGWYEEADALERVVKGLKARAYYTEDLDTNYTKQKAMNDLISDYGDLFEGTSVAIDAVIGKYQKLNETLVALYNQGSITKDVFNQVHATLQKNQTLETRKAAIANLQTNMSNDAEGVGGSWMNHIAIVSGKLAGDFTTVQEGIKTGFTDAMVTVGQKAEDVFAGIIKGTTSVSDAVRELASTFASSIISALVKVMAQWLALQIFQSAMGKSAAADATATAAVTGPAIAASYAPAAAATSVATLGTGALIGIGAAIAGISLLIGMFAGGFDQGGRIPNNSWGIVGEFGPEIVNGPANVTGRKDTAALLGSVNSGSSQSSGDLNVQVNNTVSNDVQANVSQNQDGGLTIDIVRKEIRKMTPGIVSDNMNNANSQISKSMSNNFKLSRNR